MNKNAWLLAIVLIIAGAFSTWHYLVTKDGNPIATYEFAFAIGIYSIIGFLVVMEEREDD